MTTPLPAQTTPRPPITTRSPATSAHQENTAQRPRTVPAVRWTIAATCTRCCETFDLSTNIAGTKKPKVTCPRCKLTWTFHSNREHTTSWWIALGTGATLYVHPQIAKTSDQPAPADRRPTPPPVATST